MLVGGFRRDRRGKEQLPNTVLIGRADARPLYTGNGLLAHTTTFACDSRVFVQSKPATLAVLERGGHEVGGPCGVAARRRLLTAAIVAAGSLERRPLRGIRKQPSVLERSAALLFALDCDKERFEISLSERAASLALNDLEEHRWAPAERFGEDLK